MEPKGVTVFHVAPEGAYKSIHKYGIDSERSDHNRWSSGPGFYAFKDAEEASWYAALFADTEPSETFHIWQVAVPPDIQISPDEALTSSGEETTAVYIPVKAPAVTCRLHTKVRPHYNLE